MSPTLPMGVGECPLDLAAVVNDERAARLDLHFGRSRAASPAPHRHLWIRQRQQLIPADLHANAGSAGFTLPAGLPAPDTRLPTESGGRHDHGALGVLFGTNSP